jgi:hypothetical protein
MEAKMSDQDEVPTPEPEGAEKAGSGPIKPPTPGGEPQPEGEGKD